MDTKPLLGKTHWRVCYDVMHMALCESCCWLEMKLERETNGKEKYTRFLRMRLVDVGPPLQASS